VPEGEVRLVEMFVAEDGELRLEEQPLTISDLVIHVGRRVSVTYRDDEGGVSPTSSSSFRIDERDFARLPGVPLLWREHRKRPSHAVMAETAQL
jgi:hypothetical protein